MRAPAQASGPDAVAAYLEDAAHTPGGHAPLVAFPTSEAEVAWVLRQPGPVLPVGAQSSLTGGATPMGERLLSLSRMTVVSAVGSQRVRVQPGVALLTLEQELQRHGLFYPPASTFRGAFVGGTAATNAAGATTFKYGSTREWIQALTVVLANGEALDLERGAVQAHTDGYFEVILADETVRQVPIPRYEMPRVAKRSAGYHAEPGMDLVDLFIGSEGTLGIITELELRLRPQPPQLLGWVAFRTESEALEAVGRLRQASRETWRSGDPRGIDVAAIESMDRRCLELIVEDGAHRESGVSIEPTQETAILFRAELPPGTDGAAAMDEIGVLDDPARPDTGLVRLCLLLRELGVLDSLQVALPGDHRRAQQLIALREAVPIAVNHRVAAAKRDDPGVRKCAADMIVPFENLPEMMACYREGFARRGLDHALWGHVSDGNIHANAIPRSVDDVLRGDEAILEFGLEVRRLGGCPLSEHGVGRSATKQALLRQLYADEGIVQMRAVKRALDPEWKLAPGVLFPPEQSSEEIVDADHPEPG
jgi:D-lactate dehydrogenase (cytochrome)